jgi:hypothetical protein
MNTLETSPDMTPGAIDPFGDPVAFLADYGIEAELVEVITLLPEAA